MHIEFFCGLCLSYRLYRDVVVLLIASVAILKFGILCELYIEDQLDFKYGVHRIPSDTFEIIVLFFNMLHKTIVSLRSG